MAKRGRPIKPDAKRNGINIRMSIEESNMLDELSKKTGKTRTELMMDGVRKQYEGLKKK